MQEAGYDVAALPGQSVDPTGFVARRELSFIVRFGNDAVAEGARRPADTVTLFATLRLYGDQPLDIVHCWTLRKRFARLPRSRGALVADIALIVIGGVTSGHVQVLIDICDRLVEEFLPEMKALARQRMASERTRRGRAMSRVLLGGGTTIIGGFAAAEYRSQIEICDMLVDEVVPGLRIALGELLALGGSARSTIVPTDRTALPRDMVGGDGQRRGTENGAPAELRETLGFSAKKS